MVETGGPSSSGGEIRTPTADVKTPVKPPAKQATLTHDFTAQGRQEVQDGIDFRILKLVCCRGVVPNVIDSQEFRDLISFCVRNGPNRSYSHISQDRLKTAISDEAASIRKRIGDLLRNEHNLTLSFDGYSTRMAQSIYTAHVTTSNRDTYFWNGYDASAESHDGHWVKGFITKVCHLHLII